MHGPWINMSELPQCVEDDVWLFQLFIWCAKQRDFETSRSLAASALKVSKSKWERGVRRLEAEGLIAVVCSAASTRVTVLRSVIYGDPAGSGGSLSGSVGAASPVAADPADRGAVSACPPGSPFEVTLYLDLLGKLVPLMGEEEMREAAEESIDALGHFSPGPHMGRLEVNLVKKVVLPGLCQSMKFEFGEEELAIQSIMVGHSGRGLVRLEPIDELEYGFEDLEELTELAKREGWSSVFDGPIAY